MTIKNHILSANLVFIIVNLLTLNNCSKHQSSSSSPDTNLSIDGSTNFIQEISGDNSKKPPYFPAIMQGGNPHNHAKPRKCGNGILNAGEECDDGNHGNFDGCSSKCEIEANFPLCTWQCDDPVCPAQCRPVCEPAQCEIQCEQLDSPENCLCEANCIKPQCEIQCPDDVCENEQCPSCQIVCNPPQCVTRCEAINPSGPQHCVAPIPECTLNCQMPQCAWDCKPASCPKPQCELQCEQSLCGNNGK